jgi:hypothetical protein
LKCPTPSISGGDDSDIRPGAFTYVFGCGFGSVTKNPGYHPGTPSYTLPGSVVLTLQNGTKLTLKSKDSEWTPDLIGGVFPDAPTGTKDQPGQLVVKRGGFTSSPRSVHYRARRALERVPSEAVKVNECDFSADANYCAEFKSWEEDQNFGAWLLGVEPWSYPGFGTATVTAYHENDLDPIGTDVGRDKYTVRVKNGYKIDSFQWSYGSDDGNAKAPEGFESGGTSTTFSMRWEVGDGYVKYGVDVFAVGPQGVPVH